MVAASGLKEIKNRIKSVKSTAKITSAMKSIAASKLKKAQDRAQDAAGYENMMNDIVTEIADSMRRNASADSQSQFDDIGQQMVFGTGKDNVQLLICISSDRGLCGGFNVHVIKESRKKIQALLDAGKTVKIIAIGKKIVKALSNDYDSMIIEKINEPPSGKTIQYKDVVEIAGGIFERFKIGEFDECHIVYNRFVSVISQPTTHKQLIPVPAGKANDNNANSVANDIADFEYHPSKTALISELMRRHITTQLYTVLINSEAGKHAARINAMDNATRNAKDMIHDLTLSYNYARQAQVTNEIIEIISGAGASS